MAASQYTFSNFTDFSDGLSVTSGQATFTGELETNGLLDVNGNVNFGGASWLKDDPAHGLTSWDLELSEDSLQDTGSATDTVDMQLYFDTLATAGIIEGVAMMYTDNSDDSMIGFKFVIPFTKLASSTPSIGNNIFTEIGGSSSTFSQGGSPTSASLSVVASSNTISLRMTHNAGPTTRNLVAAWRTLSGPLNS